jgi:hypothetical protein
MQSWKFFSANSFTCHRRFEKLSCSVRSRVALEEDQDFPINLGFIFVAAT